jgi:hypothetical protein
VSDAYAWTVHYRDGSAIGQINADGQDTGSWRKVDVRNVAIIRLEPQRPDLPLHGVIVPEGATAVLSFQRGHTLDLNTGEQYPNPVMVIAGWERDNTGAYLWIDSEGNTALSYDRDALPTGV